MQNQIIQQSFIEFNAHENNITDINLAINIWLISWLLDALKWSTMQCITII